MKKLVSGAIFLILGLALALGVFFTVDDADIGEALLNFSLTGFLWILLLSVFATFVTAWRYKLILAHKDIHLSLRHLWGVWLAGNAFNYITPIVYLGGEGVKGYLLKDKHNVPWGKSLFCLALDRFVEITIGLIVIVGSAVVLLSFLGVKGLANSVVGIIVSSAIAFLIFGFLYYMIFRNKRVFLPLLKLFSAHKTKPGKFVVDTESEFLRFFEARSKTMWKVIGLSLLKQVVFLARHILLIYYITGGIMLGGAILSLGVLYLGFTAPIPGALGIQEALQSILFSIIGLTGGGGFALSLVLRGADFVLVAAGVYILLKRGIRLMASGVSSIIQEKLNTNSNNN